MTLTVNPNPNANDVITWGDEILPTSMVTHESLGGDVGTHAYSGFLLVISADGTRRVVAEKVHGIFNILLYPYFLTEPADRGGQAHRWEIIRGRAISLLEHPDEKVILWHFTQHSPSEPGTPHIGKYLPYTVSVNKTHLSATPTNHITSCNNLKEILTTIAHGWDRDWRSRFVWHDHLRQQVTGKMVDGMLAHAYKSVLDYEAATVPGATGWEVSIKPIEKIVKNVCDVCYGDSQVWGRRFARNMDLAAFNVKLLKGEIPKINTETTPWSPGDTITKIVLPDTLDENQKRTKAAEWHGQNWLYVEDNLLPYYDTVVANPVR